jgi:hypothetical protein
MTLRDFRILFQTKINFPLKLAIILFTNFHAQVVATHILVWLPVTCVLALLLCLYIVHVKYCTYLILSDDDSEIKLKIHSFKLSSCIKFKYWTSKWHYYSEFVSLYKVFLPPPFRCGTSYNHRHPLSDLIPLNWHEFLNIALFY